MAKKPKYKTYKALSDAFRSGKLSRHYYIQMDKGGDVCHLCYHNPAASQKENARINNKCADLFDSSWEDRTVPALFEALEIPCQWC